MHGELVIRYLEFCFSAGFHRRYGMYSRCCLLTQLEKCSRKNPCCSFLMFCGDCFRVLVLSSLEKLKHKWDELSSSRGCIACCKKPSLDKPSSRRRTKGQPGKKEPEYLWSSGTFEMNHSTIQSQRSISSICISDLMPDPQSSTCSGINPSEFVNHGLILWNQTRQEWIGKRKWQSQIQVREARISWNATYQSLLGNNKPFGHRIPMGEMIDFLVDIWEQEGLYDW